MQTFFFTKVKEMPFAGHGEACRGKRGYKFKKLPVESNLCIWLSGSIYKNMHQGKISATVVQVETSPVKFLLKFTSQLFQVLKPQICKDIIHLKEEIRSVQ